MPENTQDPIAENTPEYAEVKSPLSPELQEEMRNTEESFGQLKDIFRRKGNASFITVGLFQDWFLPLFQESMMRTFKNMAQVEGLVLQSEHQIFPALQHVLSNKELTALKLEGLQNQMDMLIMGQLNEDLVEMSSAAILKLTELLPLSEGNEALEFGLLELQQMLAKMLPSAPVEDDDLQPPTEDEMEAAYEDQREIPAGLVEPAPPTEEEFQGVLEMRKAREEALINPPLAEKQDIDEIKLRKQAKRDAEAALEPQESPPAPEAPSAPEPSSEKPEAEVEANE
jgi:hypothetical protein